MIVLQTMAVAFAMFSALPVPQFTWNSKNMRYALCAFPLIGGVIGALWSLCGALPLPDMIRAGGFCLIPVLVTGGIHLDGYADTSDALSSYGDREKKLEILKDPHCGAFAVIRLCTYFLAYFCVAFCIRFSPRVGLCWTLALVLERGLSGLAVAAFPMAKNTGLAHTLCHGGRPGKRSKNPDRSVRPAGCGAHCAGRRGTGGGGSVDAVAVPPCGRQGVWRHHGGSGRVVFAKSRILDAGGAGGQPVGRHFIT